MKIFAVGVEGHLANGVGAVGHTEDGTEDIASASGHTGADGHLVAHHRRRVIRVLMACDPE